MPTQTAFGGMLQDIVELNSIAQFPSRDERALSDPYLFSSMDLENICPGRFQ
jgi:hypothetical protein